MTDGSPTGRAVPRSARGYRFEGLETTMAEESESRTTGGYGTGGRLEGAWCVLDDATGEVTFAHVFDTTEDEFEVEDGCVALMYDVYSYSEADGAWAVSDGGSYYGYHSVRELCMACLGFDPDAQPEDPLAAAGELEPDDLDRIVHSEAGWEDALLAAMDRVPTLAHAPCEAVSSAIPMGLWEAVRVRLSAGAGPGSRSARAVLRATIAGMPKPASLATAGGYDFWVDPAGGRMYATDAGTNDLACIVAARRAGEPWVLLPDVPSGVSDALSCFASGRIADERYHGRALAFRAQDLRLMGCDADGAWLSDDCVPPRPVPECLRTARDLADLGWHLLHSRVGGGRAPGGTVRVGSVGVPVRLHADLAAGHAAESASHALGASGGMVTVSWPTADARAEWGSDVPGAGRRGLATAIVAALDQACGQMAPLVARAFGPGAVRAAPHDPDLDGGWATCADGARVSYFLSDHGRGGLSVRMYDGGVSWEARQVPWAYVAADYDVRVNGRDVGGAGSFRAAIDLLASATGASSRSLYRLLRDPTTTTSDLEPRSAIVDDRTGVSVVPHAYRVRTLFPGDGSGGDPSHPAFYRSADEAISDAVSAVRRWAGAHTVDDINSQASHYARMRELWVQDGPRGATPAHGIQARPRSPRA